MCELFGLLANREVFISFTWLGFLRRGEVNYSGWGVAWYLGGGVALVKEPRPAPESPIAKLLLEGIRSHIVVSHVRLATQGSCCYVNTHSFVRKLGDREWVFAHYGNVSGVMDDPDFRLRYYFPIGETDFEYAFCYIMDNLSSLGSGLNNVVKVSKMLWELASKIGAYWKFNFLLSNGGVPFRIYESVWNTSLLTQAPTTYGSCQACR